MKTKSVLFFIEGLFLPAGTERIAVNLANALWEEKIDVYFVVLSESTESFYPLHEGIEVCSLKVKFNNKIKAIIRLRQLIKKRTPDYVVNVGVPMGRISIPATWGLKMKIVGWEHFNLHAGSQLGFYWRLLSAKLSYKTIVLTQKDRFDYLAKVKANVVSIPNFVTNFQETIAKLDSNIALSVGRLHPQKGYDMLLEAWAIVLKKRPEWTLYIVGSGEEEEQLKHQVKLLGIGGSVIFVPATNDIVTYYQDSSLYVMSSRFEGMPMVLLEAKMFGLPCVSFNCPNGPNEIIHDGVDGLIVEPENIYALAEAILRMLADRNMIKEFGRKAKQDVEQRYISKVVVQQWINLFL